MEKYIKKYFWTINLVTIAICSFLAAKTTNTFIGAFLGGGNTTEIRQAVAAPSTISTKKSPVERKTLHDPFTGEKLIPPDPEEIDQEELPETVEVDDPGQFTEDTACPKTSLSQTLIGTFASTDPLAGFAMFKDGDKGVTLLDVGQSLQTGVTIKAVVRHKVFVDNSGKIECFHHGEVKEVAEKKPNQPSEPADDGIRKVSETEFVLEQGEVNRLLENLNVLATQARIVPSFKNGQSNGFRIYSIKSGSFYEKVGIKNGDIIQRVNGMDINSPDKALEIYTKLRSERNINVNILRRGKPVQIDLSIQ